jgi:hypothetical protein
MATLLNKIHADPRYDDEFQAIWLSALADGASVESDFRDVVDQSLQNVITIVTETIQLEAFLEAVARGMRDRDYPDQVDTPFEDPLRAEYIDRARAGLNAAVAGIYDPPDTPTQGV